MHRFHILHIFRDYFLLFRDKRILSFFLVFFLFFFLGGGGGVGGCGGGDIGSFY